MAQTPHYLYRVAVPQRILSVIQKGTSLSTTGDVLSFLQIGLKPDGDFATGAMADVIDDATGKLTKADVMAIATYLKSLPAIRLKPMPRSLVRR